MNALRLRGAEVHVAAADLYPSCHPEALPIGTISDETIVLRAIIYTKRQQDLQPEPFAYISPERYSSEGVWLNELGIGAAEPQES